MNPYHDNPAFLFELRIPTSAGMVVVYAYESTRARSQHGHTYIDTVVRLNGDTVFKHGDTYCGIPAGTTIDGISAKEAVLSLIAMKPGDTDESYFEHYSAEQLAFAESLGEELSMIREWRYCDDNGAVKDPRPCVQSERDSLTYSCLSSTHM